MKRRIFIVGVTGLSFLGSGCAGPISTLGSANRLQPAVSEVVTRVRHTDVMPKFTSRQLAAIGADISAFIEEANASHPGAIPRGSVVYKVQSVPGTVTAVDHKTGLRVPIQSYDFVVETKNAPPPQNVVESEEVK